MVSLEQQYEVSQSVFGSGVRSLTMIYPVYVHFVTNSQVEDTVTIGRLATLGSDGNTGSRRTKPNMLRVSEARQ